MWNAGSNLPKRIKVTYLLTGRNMEKNKELRTNAQNLRKNMTKEEAHLWYQCLCRAKYRFRRQYVIGNYIVDFYCHQAKLVIELDGSQHCTPEEMEYDKKRTAFLESRGLKVVRFSNLDVMRRFRDVCETIYQLMEARTAQKP
jgi:very-short-patch-repair endonuclease